VRLVRRAQCGGGGLGQSVLEAALFGDAGLARQPDGRLEFAGVDLAAVVREVDTPAYLYSGDVIRRQFRGLDDAFARVPHRIHFAVKANGNLAVLRVLRELGAGADIVSRGELARVLAAGFPPDRIVFSGVGKRTDELEAAARAGIGSINVESLDELAAVGRLAEALDQPIRVGIRLNPDVTADTHPFISTGQSGIKFGIPSDQAAVVARLLKAHRRLEVTTLARYRHHHHAGHRGRAWDPVCP
jgi:diaminopimelate decarboxylase